MNIEWDTELYRKIRKNFLNQHCVKHLPFPNIVELFRQELRKHGATFRTNSIESMPRTLVVDTLGMCSYVTIKFQTEQQYAWFLMRWS